MELRQLENFVAVAEERSFTRAAAACIRSSRRCRFDPVARKGVDTRLFARTTHQVALTDAGQALLPEARRTLEAVAAARSAVAEANEGMRGTLRLGLMQSLTLVDVAGLIARFHQERPLVTIQPRPATGDRHRWPKRWDGGLSMPRSLPPVVRPFRMSPSGLGSRTTPRGLSAWTPLGPPKGPHSRGHPR